MHVYNFKLAAQVAQPRPLTSRMRLLFLVNLINLEKSDELQECIMHSH